MAVADFAKPIVDARARGLRPADMVIVSDDDLGLHRSLPNPVVRVRREQRPTSLDWRFLADLEVEIAVDKTVDSHVGELIVAVGRVLPSYLGVWYLATDRVVPILYRGLHLLFYPFTTVP